jgi:hypothetical protein
MHFQHSDLKPARTFASVDGIDLGARYWRETGAGTMNIASDRHIGREALGLACLSLASGCTDVLTFLNLGDVFTSAIGRG